jgi:hypothetical protein
MQLDLSKIAPHVAYIRVYDKNAVATADGTVPRPLLVPEVGNGEVIS